MTLPPANRLLPALVAAALLALPGCGFRGPLYLPGETPPGAEAPARTEEGEAATDQTVPEQADDQEEDAEEGDAGKNDSDTAAPVQP